ncbi:hypothetical protein ACHABQ_02990 [Nesterenkonia aurantiaca]|uniref:hypothetical protein n=1 Tax=Nesterenkonia aurantiaca TaxID=1436010 RepID=UPI003EE6EC95
MGFEFQTQMLFFLAFGGFGLFIALNREKVHEANKRWDEKSRLPKFFHRTYKDPNGRRNQFGGAGMAVIAAVAILLMGFGGINS